MSTELEASRRAASVERWIAQARAGDHVALDRLLGAYLACLLAAADRGLNTALRGRLDPSDLVQDTLIEAWQDFAQFRGESEADLLAWLRQILRHNLANERRRHIYSAMRSIRREVALSEAASSRLPGAADHEAESPTARIEDRERRDTLESSLRRLPEHYRQALCLHSQDGLTFAQVGGRLACSAEAARKLWGRAAEELARLLGDIWKT
jgi:RNA polymerase sigma-70 factor (ECF subfamily)